MMGWRPCETWAIKRLRRERGKLESLEARKKRKEQYNLFFK
ncbi:MAG: hypothetical protein PVH61_18095 [Candidatus Aminicenantes bacterium]